METIIVITSEVNKKRILKKLSQNKLLYNLKFYKIDDIKKKVYFSYDNKALEYIMVNYGVNINIAKIYLENLYYLKDISDEKVKFLNKLRKELDENNLLIRDDFFKEYIKNKRVIVYGYNNLSLKEKIVLDNFKVEYQNEEKKIYEHKVYEAETILEEVEFVFDKICKLINEGVLLNNIKVIIPSEYTSIFKRYLEIFKIPFNARKSDSFFGTLIAQEFLKEYDNYEIEDLIFQLKDKYDNINDLITIINKSVLILDKDLRKEFIINDLKNTSIKTNSYDRAVEEGSIKQIYDDDNYVFLLGFNINNYPVIKKDEHYLSDRIKEQLGIDTSILENKINKLDLIDKIKEIKNLTISYKLSSRNGKCYPSFLIKEMGLEVEKIKIDDKCVYSKLNAVLKYAKSLDNLYKFNIKEENLGLYRSNLNIKYREYNNEFKGINITKFKNSLNNNLTLAYTNMEMYNECAFHYYLSKVLKIDVYEESFKTIMGIIVHHILEKVLKKDINIDGEIMQFIKDKQYKIGAREFFYLEKLSKELENTINIIKEQEKHSKLNKYLFEEELYVYKDYEDILVTFKGLIDKVMYVIDNEKEVLAVVDYKTGDAKVMLDNLDYGLNLQLPIYLYLLKKSERFKEAVIGGFYIQRVMSKIPVISDKKEEDLRRDNLKLQGFSNSDTHVLELIDDEYQNSKIIKNLRYKKDGSLYKGAKVLSNKEMDELTVKVEDKINLCVLSILKGDFKINPKVIGDKNISCMYCKFKDICYVKKEDEVYLGGEENEFDGGTEASSLS